MVLRRGTGRIDRFTSADGATALFAVTSTKDTLAANADGTYTLTTAGTAATRLFDTSGKLLSIRDGSTIRVSLDYDTSSHLTAAHYSGTLIHFTADSTGRITAIQDTAGRSVSFAYDSSGRLAQQTNADGAIVAYQYDSNGNLLSIAWAGGTTTVAYSGDPGFQNVASVTTPDAAVRQYSDPVTPTQIQVTDGNGDATLYVSDTLGLLQSVTDPAGNITTYTYDTNGNRTRAVNPAGEAFAFTYDTSGNLIGITDPANNHWTADYSNGTLAHVTDPNKNVWAFQYDANTKLTTVNNPAGSLSATRNTAGQITSLTDPDGNKSTWQYDANGLLTGFTDALNNQWQYTYDGAARVAVRTDPSGATLQASYTPANRLANLTAVSVPNNRVPQLTFDYSGAQRDSLNRLATYTDSFGNQIAYTYDAASQLTSLTLPGGKTISYTYDHLHRLSKVADWQGNFALYSYDSAGYPLSVSVSGGPVTIYQYDAARSLRAIVSTGPDGTPVAGYRYTLDPNGNRTAVSALEPNTSSFTLPAYIYGFDADNRPITRSDGVAYQYTPLGNLSAVQGTHNLTFAYDPFGRLQSLAGDSGGVYSYDPAGLRVTHNDRRYLCDLSSARPRIVMETDSSNTPIAWYVYGLGLLWKVTADGTTYFYHFDGDGNTVALSNPSAGVVNQYRYDPAGLLVASNEAVENLFRAHGEAGWADDANGLLFTGAQFQFPELRLTLPATVDPAPPAPDLTPRFPGAGACFFQGVANCQAATGGRLR
jgi:YD repeat-containing protein